MPFNLQVSALPLLLLLLIDISFQASGASALNSTALALYVPDSSPDRPVTYLQRLVHGLTHSSPLSQTHQFSSAAADARNDLFVNSFLLFSGAAAGQATAPHLLVIPTGAISAHTLEQITPAFPLALRSKGASSTSATGTSLWSDSRYYKATTNR